MDIQTDDHGRYSFNTHFRRSSATYHSAHFGQLPFPNTLFSAVKPPRIGVEGVPPILRTVSDYPVSDYPASDYSVSDYPGLFQDQCATPARPFRRYPSGVQDTRRFLPHF